MGKPWGPMGRAGFSRRAGAVPPAYRLPGAGIVTPAARTPVVTGRT